MNDGVVITKEMVSAMCPVRPENGHKGTFGTALICSGSLNMTGAQTLMTQSALRSGVGLVKVFAPEESMSVTRVLCPCAIYEPFAKSSTEVLSQYKKMKKISAAGIGPGIGESDDRYKVLLSELIISANKLVIDAGALNIISRYKQEYLPLIKARTENGLSPAILTPHVGEFMRLTGTFEGNKPTEEDLRKMCVQFALENQCVTVVKNHKTIISSPSGEWYISCVGNDGMAKGGSGDVLTGLITGFLAQGIEAIDAAISGVYIHGLAGDIAASELGKRFMLPSDMPDFLAESFVEVGW